MQRKEAGKTSWKSPSLAGSRSTPKGSRSTPTYEADQGFCHPRGMESRGISKPQGGKVLQELWD